MVPSEHETDPYFVIGNARSDVAMSSAVEIMTENLHLLSWSAALPKCLRERRKPRREAVGPLVKEPRIAGHCNRRGCRMRFTRGVETRKSRKRPLVTRLFSARRIVVLLDVRRHRRTRTTRRLRRSTSTSKAGCRPRQPAQESRLPARCRRGKIASAGFAKSPRARRFEARSGNRCQNFPGKNRVRASPMRGTRRRDPHVDRRGAIK
jgi:hypothetical protein